MLTAWRIVKAKYQASAFDGEGARLYGGRWTSAGRRAVYASNNLALATLELVVHLDSVVPLPAYVMIELGIPEACVTKIEPRSLPRRWRDFPAPAALAKVGDAWLDAGSSAVLQVPSAVVPMEWNFVINPAHADFRKITRGRSRPYRVDPRLG